MCIRDRASSFADSQMKEGDEVIVSVMEHHSNIVPWQLPAARKGIVLKAVSYPHLANELASMMDIPVTQVIATCMSIGIMVSINQRQMCIRDRI